MVHVSIKEHMKNMFSVSYTLAKKVSNVINFIKEVGCQARWYKKSFIYNLFYTKLGTKQLGLKTWNFGKLYF